MRIAVTGASGFIGRHVIPVLIKNNNKVTAVVRDKTKVQQLANDCQIVEHVIGSENRDIYNKLGKPDVLIHLAWGGLPNYNSMHHIDVELPIHYQFLKNMIESGVKNIAVIGTCFEYGMQSGALSEELSTIPDNPYGYAKDALRKQLQFLKSEYDFNLTWMRLFYMYGEDQPENTLYSQLRTAVEQGKTIFNMSGGEQLRDYLHIDVVAKKITEIACKKEALGIVNICSGVPVSVRCLVERWMEENSWGIELNLGYYPYPEYEPFAFWGNADKLNRIINLGV